MRSTLAQKRRGFTLIEILIDLMVFTLIATAVLFAYMATLKSMASARTRIAAVSLANEKMEIIRNMPYDSMATEHGPIYPPGEIKDYETLSRNGVSLNVRTVISYIDDAYDGMVSSDPADMYPYDYKKVEITVTKEGQDTEYAKISSIVAAKASETSSNTGIIMLCIVDSHNLPVEDAVITIQNPDVDPAVNISATTDNQGCITVPKLPPDNHNHYHLTATKDGYSTDMTYPRTAQNPNSLQPDVDVYVQQVTLQTLSIDKVSTMEISVVDENNSPVASTSVHIEGTKEKWFDPSTKKYSEDHITDENGQIILQNMEFDDYSFSVDGWIVLSTSPYQPTKLEAETTLPVLIKVTQDGSKPVIKKCDPIVGISGDSLASITITGQNFQSGLSISFTNTMGQSISGTDVAVSSHAGTEYIDANFNLGGATTGSWDILVTNPDGNTVLQKDGFTIQ